MWLLDVNTPKLSSLFGKIPPYIILSHRWAEDEITFQDVQNRTNREKAGYVKVYQFTKVVKLQWPDVQYCWVDTCCIDKTNSAELSEAINSMYRWYERAVACVTYMQDVCDMSDFESSEWLNCGWTLQELLAPKEVYFYSTSWQRLGTRSRLHEFIETASAIPSRYLGQDFTRKTRPLAMEIFSWMASRTTTREEDEAYCLFGLLDVNLHLLYGEGKQAFIRLQKEYLSQTGDLSVFC